MAQKGTFFTEQRRLKNRFVVHEAAKIVGGLKATRFLPKKSWRAEMPVGRVKWYDKSKGYGFIENPEGDVFFHFSDILMEGFKALAEDQRVSYKITKSANGLKAKDIKPLDNRASVRHAARYRTMLTMTVSTGKEKTFDKYMSEIPAWFDAMEQNLGLRRIGIWRMGKMAIRLIESDKPYDQAAYKTEISGYAEEYTAWEKNLLELLDDVPTIMSPVGTETPVSETEL